MDSESESATHKVIAFFDESIHILQNIEGFLRIATSEKSETQEQDPSADDIATVVTTGCLACETGCETRQHHVEQREQKDDPQAEHSDWLRSRRPRCAVTVSCYQRATQSDRADIRQHLKQLCQRKSPLLRCLAAYRLQELASVVEPEFFIPDLLTLYSDLFRDSEESVVMAVVWSCVNIAHLLPLAQKRAVVVRILSSAVVHSSWRVRRLVATMLIEAQHGLGPEVDLTDVLCNLLDDMRGDVQAAAAQHIADFCQNLPPETQKSVVLDQMWPRMKTLGGDKGDTAVRIAVAPNFAALASVLGADKTAQVLLPQLFQVVACVRVDEVRVGAVRNLDCVYHVLSAEQMLPELVPWVVRLTSDRVKGVRLTAASYMPLLAEKLGKERFNEELVVACIQLLADGDGDVKQASSQAMKELVELLGSRWAQERLIPTLKQISEDTHALGRLGCLFCISMIAEMLGREVTASVLLPIVVHLSVGHEPYIRRIAARTLKLLSPLLSAHSASWLQIQGVLDTLKADTDSDVRSFASEALDVYCPVSKTDPNVEIDHSSSSETDEDTSETDEDSSETDEDTSETDEDTSETDGDTSETDGDTSETDEEMEKLFQRTEKSLPPKENHTFHCEPVQMMEKSDLKEEQASQSLTESLTMFKEETEGPQEPPKTPDTSVESSKQSFIDETFSCQKPAVKVSPPHPYTEDEWEYICQFVENYLRSLAKDATLWRWKHGKTLRGPRMIALAKVVCDRPKAFQYLLRSYPKNFSVQKRIFGKFRNYFTKIEHFERVICNHFQTVMCRGWRLAHGNLTKIKRRAEQEVKWSTLSEESQHILFYISIILLHAARKMGQAANIPHLATVAHMCIDPPEKSALADKYKMITSGLKTSVIPSEKFFNLVRFFEIAARKLVKWREFDDDFWAMSSSLVEEILRDECVQDYLTKDMGLSWEQDRILAWFIQYFVTLRWLYFWFLAP